MSAADPCSWRRPSRVPLSAGGYDTSSDPICAAEHQHTAAEQKQFGTPGESTTAAVVSG